MLESGSWESVFAEFDGLNKKPHSWHRKTSLSAGDILFSLSNRKERQRRQRKSDHLQKRYRDGPTLVGSSLLFPSYASVIGAVKQTGVIRRLDAALELCTLKRRGE